MALTIEDYPLSIAGLPELARRMSEEGWRYVQTLAVNTDEGVDLVYSFMKPPVLANYTIKAVQKGTPIPSITDRFFAAFVFENEAHDLFGVDIRDIAIDFKGHFYAVAQNEPMTIISPEQKAAREKAAKLAAAKRARAKKASSAAAEYASTHDVPKPKRSGEPLDVSALSDQVFYESRVSSDPEKVARAKAALAAKAERTAKVAKAAEAIVIDPDLEERLAKMDPEKAARIRAAMARKAKLADLPPEKAERVRAAMEAKARLEVSKASGQTTLERDAEIEAKLSQLDPERAAKVRAALDAKARRETAEAERAEKVAVLEERLKRMDPERASKVRAAFEAKQRGQAAREAFDTASPNDDDGNGKDGE